VQQDPAVGVPVCCVGRFERLDRDLSRYQLLPLVPLNRHGTPLRFTQEQISAPPPISTFKVANWGPNASRGGVPGGPMAEGGFPQGRGPRRDFRQSPWREWSGTTATMAVVRPFQAPWGGEIFRHACMLVS
jgi:hypothetical protein